MTHMKIKSGFVVERVGSRYLAVAVGVRADEFNALIRMNESGAFIWSCLAESEKSIDEAADLLAAEYGIDRERALRDVDLFVAKLREADLIDE